MMNDTSIQVNEPDLACFGKRKDAHISAKSLRAGRKKNYFGASSMLLMLSALFLAQTFLEASRLMQAQKHVVQDVRRTVYYLASAGANSLDSAGVLRSICADYRLIGQCNDALVGDILPIQAMAHNRQRRMHHSIAFRGDAMHKVQISTTPLLPLSVVSLLRDGAVFIRPRATSAGFAFVPQRGTLQKPLKSLKR